MIALQDRGLGAGRANILLVLEPFGKARILAHFGMELQCKQTVADAESLVGAIGGLSETISPSGVKPVKTSNGRSL